MVAKVYSAGWEAVCNDCPDSSGLHENRAAVAAWAKEHNRVKHPRGGQ
jgi:hypothetical protein